MFKQAELSIKKKIMVHNGNIFRKSEHEPEKEKLERKGWKYSVFIQIENI